MNSVVGHLVLLALLLDHERRLADAIPATGSGRWRAARRVRRPPLPGGIADLLVNDPIEKLLDVIGE